VCAAGQAELDLGLGGQRPSGPVEIASSRMGRLRDALCRECGVLGFPQATVGACQFTSNRSPNVHICASLSRPHPGKAAMSPPDAETARLA
jgi:hypothetical protein